MLDNSKDLVNISLSFGIVLLSVLLAFVLYYIIKILKDAYSMIHEVSSVLEEFKNHLKAWEDFLDSIKDRMSSVGNYLPLVVDGVTKLVDFLNTKRQEKKNRK